MPSATWVLTRIRNVVNHITQQRRDERPTAATVVVAAVGRLRSAYAVGVAPNTRWMSGFIAFSCAPQ